MLSLFPQGLDGTLLVPVLIGALFMAACTEWWGWDFVGIVVPGYLASVGLLEPVVVGVVFVEAAITYALVVALDRGMRGLKMSFATFGRDRFFLVLVCSVATRVVLEGFALQWMAGRLASSWPGIADYRSDLFGIGVVLVPLTANRFWRPGILRGSFELGLQTLAVAAVIGWVLVRWTNFSIGGFELAYDHLALSFVSSPRAQMTLLVTAALASELNRRYGWDFHGILVPALLALALITPLKLAATVVEALAIVFLAKSLLRLPTFRNANVEGPRKVILCFLVGFGLKLVLAKAVSAGLPGYRVSDFFGLGYVLPSLLAERMWLKQNLPLVLVPTVQTAIVGAGLGGALAVGLSWIAPVQREPEPKEVPLFESLPQAVAALAKATPAGRPPPLASLVERLREGMPDAKTLDGFVVAVSEGRLLAARSAHPTRLERCAPKPAERVDPLTIGPDLALFVAPPEELRGATLTATEAPLVSTASCAPTLAARSLEHADRPQRALILTKHTPPSSVAPPRAAVGAAAVRIHALRSNPVALAEALTPLGLRVVMGNDGGLVVIGPGWPSVAIQRPSLGLVVAPHSTEIGTAEIALRAGALLQVDAVVAGVASPELCTLLAQGLAQLASSALLVVRGTERLRSGEAFLATRPEPLGPERWFEPLAEALRGRLEVSLDPNQQDPALLAFGNGGQKETSTTLLWLSRAARRVQNSGDEWLEHPEWQALAVSRQVMLLRDDPYAWVRQGSSAPSQALIELGVELAQSHDVARLSGAATKGAFAVYLDEARGLSGIAISAGTARAIVLAGERRIGTAQLRASADLIPAIESGARLLVPAP